MRQIIPRIMIEKCKEAVAYYHGLFGGEIKNVQLSDGMEMYKGQEGKYIHAELHVTEQCVLYFSDIFQNNIAKGNHIQLALDLEDEAEITRLYASLAKDGEVKMELQDTYWNAKYGIVTDPYGVTWELNFPKQSHK